MKRITALLLAFALMLGTVGTAEADAVDIKVKGQWDFGFGITGNGNWYNNKNRTNGNGLRARADRGRSFRRDDDRFIANQRIRTQVNFITSEYLQAVLHFEIGDMRWGRPGRGAQLNGDSVNVETKHAYLDWLIPETDVSVRMGLQRIALPSTRLANPILDADVAGVVVSSPITDWLGVTALWARPWDLYRNDNDDYWGSSKFAGRSLADETDVFGVILPMSFSDFGTSISPYFLYGFLGGNSGHVEYLFPSDYHDFEDTIGINETHSKAKAWWAGTNITFDLFDPLVASVDVAYGHLNKAEYDWAGALNKRGDTIHAGGWFIAGTLDYKMDWMTPGIFGWWSSGDKKKDLKNGRIGRMPFVSNDGGNFSPTSFGTNGYFGIGNSGNNAIVSGTGLGTWGIGIQVADVSFIEDLSHTLRFAYYQGTNGKDCGKYAMRHRGDFTGFDPAYVGDSLYMTTKDKAFEINFDHEYKIYENLTAVLELGYIHLKSSKEAWGGRNRNAAGDPAWGKGSGLKENSNAYKAQLNFQYKF